ncbi:MAG: DHHA1 domain-containing protein [Desulfurococcales archaeon]|nr:DHHA1 domain-containing protein [Desulfurococcales archaeon]
MNHLFIVTHTDLDGVGSAAVYLRLSGVEEGFATIVYAEPYNLDEVLDNLQDNVDSGDRLVIADLGPNKAVFERVVEIVSSLSRKGVEVEWYDHHVWEPSEVDALSKAGVRIHVDRSTCATGVVARYYPEEHEAKADDVTERIVSAVCAADLWRWDDPLAPKLFRVAGNRHETEWKTRLAFKLAKGVLWDEEMAERLEDYVNKELAGMDATLRRVVVMGSAGSCRVAATIKEEGPPSNSIIGALLLSRYNADIAVIIRPNGAISLRSRRVNVQILAKELGGGGHPRAAGARVKIGLLTRLLSLFYPKALPRRVASLIVAKASSLGICRSLQGSTITSGSLG